MLKQTEGSHAVAEAVALCRPEVICAYPISPQTHIVEGLGEMVKSGDARRLRVHQRRVASSPRCRVAIGASAAGARTYTATSSQGLLFMAEAVYNAVGARPADRDDHRQSRDRRADQHLERPHRLACRMRDSGWIQLFAETNQEALDLHIQAFRLAEELSMPVMVCMDGFILTHAYERVDMPDAGRGRRLSCRRTSRARCSIRPIRSRSARWSGRRRSWKCATSRTPSRLRALELHPAASRPSSRERFGRNSGGLVRSYRCEDAETIVVALGSVIGTIKDTVDEMRDAACTHRRARRSVVPPVPARRGARGARRRAARRRAREEPRGRPRRHRLRPTCARPVGLAAARLHGHRRPRRARDHARRRSSACCARRSPTSWSRSPSSTSTGASSTASSSAKAQTRRSGPIAENLLRDVGRRSQRRWPDEPARQVLPDRHFTVGNRLLGPSSARCRPTCERTNSLNSGHRACQGCGEALGARYAIDAAMRATGNQLIAANATGCLEVFSTPYPETSWQMPWIHSLFGNAAAVASGIAAALQGARAASDVRVVAPGRRRRHDRHRLRLPLGHVRAQRRRALHLLRQRGLHEHRRAAQLGDAARRRARRRRWRSGHAPGAEFGKGKNVPRIAMAHEIPYVATATRRRPARPRGQGRAARWACAARATCTSSCRARSAGARQPRHDPARAAGARDRNLPGVRGRARRGDAR